MPGTGISIANTFNAEAGQVPASQLDANFAQLVAGYNNLVNFSNYYLDTGGANAIVITVPAPLVVAYVAGLPLQIKVANTNTGATTININGLGGVAVVYPGTAAAMSSGQLAAGAIIPVMFDGTNFQYLGAVTSATPSGAANLVYATPNGASGAASLRALVAADIPGLAVFTARKANTTSRTGAPIATNDPDLVLAGLPAGTYNVNALLAFNCTTTGTQGITIGVSVLGGGFTTGLHSYTGWINGAAAQSAGATSTVAITRAPIDTGVNDCVVITGEVVLAANTTYGVTWGQASSSANATNMLAGSYLTLQKVA